MSRQVVCFFGETKHNGESVPALVALSCADTRLFASARSTRTVVFLLTSHAWLKRKSHPHCVARVRHTFSELGSGAMVPGSVNS